MTTKSDDDEREYTPQEIKELIIKNKAVIIPSALFLLGIILGAGLFSGILTPPAAEHSLRVSRVEFLMDYFYQNYGNSSMDEFQTILNVPDVPKKYWNENITAKEMIEAYYNYHAVSPMFLEIVMGYVCK